MNVTYHDEDGVFIMRLNGDLIGENSSPSIMDKVNDAVSSGRKACIVDISGVRYINSSGIGMLITILTKFRNKDGEVFLLKPSDAVQKLLVITKLNAIFRVVQSERDVMDELKKS